MKRYWAVCNGTETYIKAENKREALKKYREYDQRVKMSDIALAKMIF